MSKAINDGIIVPLVYEGRKVKQEEPALTINNYFDSLTADLPKDMKEQLSDKFSRFKAIAEASSRINLIAFDIHQHFINYCIPKVLKAMIVCSSRVTVIEMYNDAESGFNGFDKNDIDSAIFGAVDEKKKLADSYEILIAMFEDVKNSKSPDVWQKSLETELKQMRYDDPLLFQEFSQKIKKTIEEYDENRDADLYYANMERMADDFRNVRMSQLANDSDAKAFYGAVITTIKNDKNVGINVTIESEEIIATYSFKIKSIISSNAKRDWKYNEVVHKAMRRGVDDCLFDMFEEMGIVIENKHTDMLDLILDEIMNVAVSRY